MSYAEPPAGLSLVLGAGGFLGSHVARWLASAGAAARLFGRSLENIPVAVRRAPGIDLIEGDLIDREAVRAALDGVVTVFHFAGATVPSNSVDRPDLEIEANVLPTLHLLDAMRDVGTSLVVFPSSGGTIYGDTPPGDGFAEDAPLRPSCSYGLGKLMIEQLLAFHLHRGGSHFLVLRIANAYGPTTRNRARQGAVNAFLAKVLLGEPLCVWGDGSAVRDLVYVDDVIGAMAALLRSGARDEVFNVASGRGHSVNEIVEAIGAVTDRHPQVQRVGVYAGVARNALDISRLRTRIGWEPAIDLREGVRRTWRSMLDVSP